MSSIIEDVLGCTDDILGLRDDLGAGKHKVYILTRTWPDKVGLGNPIDTIEQILPTPYLVDYSHSLRLREGGKVKEGDKILKHLSKQSYPLESDIDCFTGDNAVEKFYYINERLYNVISVVEDYVYWNVQVRKTAKNKVYL